MKHKPHESARVPAFTLVELLAVISVILILLALLVPAVRFSMDKSKSMACLSNLRQIGTGSTVFLAEYNRLPVGGSLVNESSATSPYLGNYPMFNDNGIQRALPYQAALAYYLDKAVRTDSTANLAADIQRKELTSVFTCRAQRTVPTNVQMLWYNGGGTPTGTSSYGFNECVMGYWWVESDASQHWTRATGRATRVDSPAGTFLYADANPRTEYNDNGGFVTFLNSIDSSGGQDATLWDLTLWKTWNVGKAGTPSLLDYNRHAKRINAVFVDGHAAGVSMDQGGMSSVNLSRGVHRSM